MRRITLFMIAFGLLLSARGQFLKSLTDNLKQTLQNRANGKANQTTDHVLDKVDSATRTTSVSGTVRIPLMGADAVSAQDSAAAIKAFTTTSGDSGYYYETAITITSKHGDTKDTALMWLTNSGEGRSEMRIPVPGVQTPKMIVIGHLAQPKYSIILDEQGKTYTLNVIDTAWINSGSGDYKVTRVGTESVSDYSCIHSRLVNTIGSGVYKTTNTYDIWTSTAGYANSEVIFTKP